MELIEWRDFEKVELRVGTIISTEINESARKSAFILNIDFGNEIGVRNENHRMSLLRLLQDQILDTPVNYASTSLHSSYANVCSRKTIRKVPIVLAVDFSRIESFL